MCNLYSISTNQEAISRLFRVVNRYEGNLAPMPGVFPDYPAPVVRNTADGRELTMMRWGMPPPPRTGGPPVTNVRNTTSPHWRGWRTRCRSSWRLLTGRDEPNSQFCDGPLSTKKPPLRVRTATASFL